MTLGSCADLTAEWLSAALGTTVTGFDSERIGTGQMSESYRVRLQGERAPDSVVLKVAAADPVSRQTGAALGLYEREVRFYSEVAPRLGGPLAPCHHASYDAGNGTFALLLGDAGPAEVGDEILGTTLERALLAVTELGRLHGPALDDDTLSGAGWLNRESPLNQAMLEHLYAGFLDRYAHRIAPAHRNVCDRLITAFEAYVAADDGPRGLVHGDYRLDNLLFGAAGADRPLTVVDWQTVTWGPALTDLAYFLGCALTPDARRAHSAELTAAYHRALGDTALTLGDVRAGVRRQSFFGLMMAIVSSMLVQQTERGDLMFTTLVERHCAHVLDVDALAILPAPAAVQDQHPDPDDERAHAATSEPMWNESWYADFVDVGQGVGGYVRLGLTPNEDAAWLTVVVCGPGRPTVSVIDFAAPLSDAFALRTESYGFSHEVESPLRAYRVRMTGHGAAHDDPSAMVRGEPGRPVDLDIDLTWTTVGTPYQYRVTPRYEIPCTVSGTVVADGQRLEFTDVIGQRDHSWGVRDWWSMEWVWSALHLDDGTHLHGVDLRIPGAPPIGIGYIQRAGAPMTELAAVAARETYADNGLPLSTTIAFDRGAVEVVADIHGHGPLRLVAPDGRVALFARAWVTVATPDGRLGAGWIEWNRNGSR